MSKIRATLCETTAKQASYDLNVDKQVCRGKFVVTRKGQLVEMDCVLAVRCNKNLSTPEVRKDLTKMDFGLAWD